MYGFVITTAGEAMLARAAAGETLVLDGASVGKGVVLSAADAKALTALIDPVAEATTSVPAVAGQQISITVEYRNDMNGGLETGFALSEFGIAAHVGDDPSGLLYYGSLGDAPQTVKPIGQGLDAHRFPVAIALTGEVSVALEYPAGGFLTQEDLEGLDYIPTSEKGKPGGVAALGSDGKVPEEELPEMDYDPAGSAEAVQDNLDAHTANKNNPHGVTAKQAGAAERNFLQQIVAGTSSAAYHGWIEVGRIKIDTAYTSVRTIFSVCGVNGRGSGILSFSLRVDGTVNVVGPTSRLYWLTLDTPDLLNSFAIEQDGDYAVLYLKLTGTYQCFHIGILACGVNSAPFVGAEDPKSFKLANNYNGAGNRKDAIDPVLTSSLGFTPEIMGTLPISAGTADLTAGSSALATGQIYLVYG